MHVKWITEKIIDNRTIEFKAVQTSSFRLLLSRP